MKRTSLVGLLVLSAFLLLGTIPIQADPAWNQYLALNPDQKAQLKAANEKRKGPLQIVRQDKDEAIQNLVNQVKANAGDAALQPILTQILDDVQVIDKSDDAYWPSLMGFLTPTQVAKIYLKGHPPRSTIAPSVQRPNNPNPHPSFKWEAYFGFNPATAQQFKAADQAKNNQMKPLHEEQEAAVEQLNQLVQSNAADSAIQPTLTTLFNAIQTEHQTEQAFWGTTLPGFLSPTQMAKLYLHRHPPKSGFNP